MKRFMLRVFGGPNVIDEVVEAETHTLENGAIIFWVKNQDDVWAQVAVYPASCTAIYRFEDINPAAEAKAQITGMPVNITADVQKVIQEIQAESKPAGKRNTKK
jgi:hypothetical protein